MNIINNLDLFIHNLYKLEVKKKQLLELDSIYWANSCTGIYYVAQLYVWRMEWDVVNGLEFHTVNSG